MGKVVHVVETRAPVAEVGADDENGRRVGQVRRQQLRAVEALCLGVGRADKDGHQRRKVGRRGESSGARKFRN